jgi:2-hydroxy-6-oxonona-2,4-dienedioate hydrolase|tara:strand:- start:117 stop:974 length:858 start_codon:yes stop_codon:yes gene_type:complete
MTIWTELLGLEFAVQYIDAAGVRTRALIAGTGEDIIFLHGTSGHLEAFSRNIIPHVEAGFKCHAIDSLGHGYTDKPDYPYEISRYVEHVINYMDAQGIEKAHFGGESLGGWTAAILAIEHPERVRTLQLIASGGTKANPEIMARLIKTTTQASMETDVDFTRKRLHLLMHNPQKDASEELVEVRYAVYHQPSFQQNLHNLLSLQNMDIRQRNMMRPEQLNMIKAPTLVIWGRNNPFGEVPEATKMHEDIPGSRLELFDDCGHWPQHERADIYNPLSISFLKENLN